MYNMDGLNQMDETKIAERKVLPRLYELGFYESQISAYNTYVIYFGSSRHRADYVCSLGMAREPYLVVEVKKREVNFDFKQVESYTQIIGAPFFALTNGEVWKWFLTKQGQGSSIEINNLPMPLDLQKLSTDSQSSLELIEEFIKDIFQKKPKRFFNGLEWHLNALEFIGSTLERLEILYKDELIQFLESDELMNSPRNYGQIEDELSNVRGVKKVKSALKHLIDTSIPFERRYDDLVRYTSDFHIYGIGPTVVTRILAATHENCFTIDSKVMQRLITLGFLKPRSIHLSGIEYRDLMKSFQPLIEENKYIRKYGLELLHYLLWFYDLTEKSEEI